MRKCLLMFLAVRLFYGCWLLAGGLMKSVAAAVSTNAPNYFMRVWQVESGLPQNKVSAIWQTRDGYLWVGTYSGLARFDGIRFTVFDTKNTPGLCSSRIACLFEGHDGALWIGHDNGAVTVCREGKFQPVEIRAAWSSRKIYGIAEDEARDVWLLNEAGLLARVRDGLVLSPQAGTALRLLNFARSPGGSIWVARDGCLSVLEQGRLRVIPLEEPVANTYVQGICASHGGGLWVSSNARLRKWQDGQWIEDMGVAPWDMVPLTGMTEARDGTLIAATPNTGIFMLFPRTGETPLHLNRFNGFQADWILSLAEDREGNFWVGSGGNGLIAMRRSHLQTFEPPDRWRGRALLSVCPTGKGELWIGTEGTGVYRYQNGDWKNFGYTNFNGNSFVWSVAEDVAGRLWVGTWGEGLFLREGEHFKTAPGLEGFTVPITALLAARDGGLWLGTAAGLLRYKDGKTNWFTGAAGKSLRDVRTIAEDGQGAVWFGTAGNGLACLEKDRLRHFSQTNGLASDYIECLRFDDEGALWIGTFGGGLVRLKHGVFSVIDRPQGLPNSVIGHIEDDGHGYFWMSSHGGIIRASKAGLNACADGKVSAVRFLTYGVHDGLPTIECAEGLQPAGGQTPDGRLWFPTSKGLVAVTPNKVSVNPLPPLMAVEEWLVDGQLVTNRAPPLQIEPGRQHLEFHYTALSFAAPEKVRFKHRIEGLEKDWVDAGTRRTVTYSFLPPGDYTFRVIASNNDGIWNEAGLALPFVMLPYFWQTWWFRLLIGAAAVALSGGLAWFATRRRMRRKLELLERQRAVENERARIAHDINDDLGAQLTSITMLSESARGQLDNPPQALDELNEIYATAREATRAMDEIVWAVNPKHDSMESLASYLEKFAIDFLRAAGIRCRLEIPRDLPAWRLTSEARHNLFLAYKEALNNVAKHAAASEVRISLALEGTSLSLLIEDNGHGFYLPDSAGPTSEAEPSAEGNGLDNMRRRVQEIGGCFEINSAPGKGTRVKFQLPLLPPAG
ncbi:MAG: hypothetical protein H7Y43_06580 [Akkermansiaceae bacterium]|nr:hypothetical protein [Verrucomicrobiales bacterium]